jgi:apolipoprotein N-acyltransferase
VSSTGSRTRPDTATAGQGTTEGTGPYDSGRRWPGLALRLAGAAAGGGLLVLAFPPYDRWPLAIVAASALSLLLHGRTVRHGLAVGFVFGLAFFVPLLHWTGIYVGPAPWLILAGAQAAYLGLLGGALVLTARLPGWPVWSAALWVAEEAVRSRGPFGGFPWGRLAFSQAGSPLAWFAAWGGAPLVSFVVALAGSLAAAAMLGLAGWRQPAAQPSAAQAQALAPLPAAERPAPLPVAQATAAERPAARRRAALAAVGLVALVAATAAARPLAPSTGTAGTVTVAVVQGNVPRLGLDFNAQREAVLRNHVQRTLALAEQVRAGQQPRPQLVIWPENAADVDPFDNPEAGALIDLAAQAIGVPILVGAVLDGPGPDHVTNAGIVWDPTTGPGERYVKRHPVPFGEYIPLRRLARIVSKDVDRVGRDMIAGDRPGLLQVGPVAVGDVICFEVAYDGLVRDAARRSGLLVVQTNNATFGRSGETWQQLAMGRLRAIEHGQTVLVAATSGVSAIIGPDGHVLDRSAVFTADLLVAQVPVRTGSTLATRLGALPEWLLVAAAGAALAAAAVTARRRRRNSEGAGTGMSERGAAT